MGRLRGYVRPLLWQFAAGVCTPATISVRCGMKAPSEGLELLRALSLALVLIAGCMGSAAAGSREVEERAAKIRASSCQTCHGSDGNSADPTVPRLNAQLASYIFARLDSMRYPIREAPRAIHSMGGVAPGLDPKVIVAIANYYARQPPVPIQLPRGVDMEGARIYKKGSGKYVPSCQGCHGSGGQGSARAPRLAGQHSEYLVMQLKAFAAGARIGDPMNHHVWLMPPEQMQAVAIFLSGKRE